MNEEVMEAVNEMKSRKAPGLDGFPVEFLKKCGMAVLKWLVRLSNMSFDMGVVHTDWRGASTHSKHPCTKTGVISGNVLTL